MDEHLESAPSSNAVVQRSFAVFGCSADRLQPVDNVLHGFLQSHLVVDIERQTQLLRQRQQILDAVLNLCHLSKYRLKE